MYAFCLRIPIRYGAYLTIIWQKTEPGILGHRKCLCAISSAVSPPIVTRLGTVKVLGLESNLAESEFLNSKRLPWKFGGFNFEDGARRNRTFSRTEPGSLGHFEDGARRPRTFLKTEPGGLGHFVRWSQAASDIFQEGARRPRTL